jgi:hypothetical protein
VCCDSIFQMSATSLDYPSLDYPTLADAVEAFYFGKLSKKDAEIILAANTDCSDAVWDSILDLICGPNRNLITITSAIPFTAENLKVKWSALYSCLISAAKKAIDEETVDEETVDEEPTASMLCLHSGCVCDACDGCLACCECVRVSYTEAVCAERVPSDEEDMRPKKLTAEQFSWHMMNQNYRAGLAGTRHPGPYPK